MIHYPNIKDAIDTPEAAQGFKEHELSKYTSQELKDELERREQPTHDTLELLPGDVCEHGMEMGYCVVKGCAGSY